MKNSGKAEQAEQELIAKAFVILMGILIVLLACTVLRLFGSFAGFMFLGLLILWFVFYFLTRYFFRDPDPRVPTGTKLVLAPGHGKVDVIDEITEPEFMGGPCQRVSIFLSLFDVHVQKAPVEGKVAFFKHKPGKFLNAQRADSAMVNENVLIGFEPKERPGQKLAVRLIAGVLARRILPWVAVGEEFARGDRISLIQFGSRVEAYLPRSAKIKIKVGDHVVGGETVIAVFE